MRLQMVSLFIIAIGVNPAAHLKQRPQNSRLHIDMHKESWPFSCKLDSSAQLLNCTKPTLGTFDPWRGVSNRSAAQRLALEDGIPKPRRGSVCAVFTVVRNEAVFLPVWLRYYLRHVGNPSDMLILDHGGNDSSTAASHIPKGVYVRKLNGDAAFMPHFYLVDQVQLHQQALLSAGYQCVVFSEVDEIIIANRDRHPMGLSGFLAHFAASNTLIYARPGGRTVSHQVEGNLSEPTMNWSTNVLAQRHYWAESRRFSKPYITKIPLQYIPGFHQGRPFTARPKEATSKESFISSSTGENPFRFLLEQHSHTQGASLVKSPRRGNPRLKAQHLQPSPPAPKTSEPVAKSPPVTSLASPTNARTHKGGSIAVPSPSDTRTWKNASPLHLPPPRSTLTSRRWGARRTPPASVAREFRSGPEIQVLDSDIVLLHLHGADYNYCMKREKLKSVRAAASMHSSEKKEYLGMHFRLFDEYATKGIMCTAKLETDSPIEMIPQQWRNQEV